MTDLQIADSMRSPKDMLSPDERGLSGFETTTIESWHSLINEKIGVSENVPLDIKIQIENIKNLLLYSWCVYRFGMVAATQSYNVLELSLEIKFKNLDTAIPNGLGPKLTKALEKQLLPHNFDKRKIDIIRSMRNTANHGSTNLLPPIVMLEICEQNIAIINHIF